MINRATVGSQEAQHESRCVSSVDGRISPRFGRCSIAQSSGEFVTESASMIHIAKMPRSRIVRMVGVPTKWNLSLQSMCSVTFVAPQNDSFEVCRRV